MEKLTTILLALASGLGLSALGNDKSAGAQPLRAGIIKNQYMSKTDTIPQSGRSILNMASNGKEYRIVRVDGKLTEFYIDGRRIPDADIPQYNTLVKELIGKSESIAIPEPPKPPSPEGSPLTDKTRENIISDLIKEGIISDRKSLKSVRLTSKELIVNKKKQPAEIHRKFGNKYITSGTTVFDFVFSQN